MILKILMIDLGSVWGGQEIYSYNLLKSYKSKNYHVISISSQKKFKDIADEFYEVSNKYTNFLTLAKIIEDISKKVDIVHFNGNRALYLSKICKKIKPFVGTKHLPYFVGGKKDFKSNISQNLGKLLLSNIDNLICVAQATYDDLPTNIQKKSTVVYNGVDIGSNKKIENIDGNLKICYIARFTKHKGIISVLELVKRLFEDGITIELSVAGKGELDQYIDDFITNNPNLSITNHGFINSPKDVYENSHLGILLSTHEGMPLNILEAFSAGLPFIAYDIPGVDEVIKNNHNGFLLEVNNEDEVFKTIKRLVNDKNLILELSKNANDDYNQKYSLDIMVNNTINIYKSLLNENTN